MSLGLSELTWPGKDFHNCAMFYLRPVLTFGHCCCLGSGSPLPRVSYREVSTWTVCRWLGHLHWIAGGTARDADPLEANMEAGGLWANMGKTKVLISGLGCDVLQKFCKDTCGFCLEGVGTNFIFLKPKKFIQQKIIVHYIRLHKRYQLQCQETPIKALRYCWHMGHLKNTVIKIHICN